MLAVVRQEEVAEGKGPTEARSTVTQETGGEEKEKEKGLTGRRRRLERHNLPPLGKEAANCRPRSWFRTGDLPEKRDRDAQDRRN